MILFAGILANVIIKQYFSDFRCLLQVFDGSCYMTYLGVTPILQVFSADSSINSRQNYNKFGCQGIVICTEHPAQTFRTYERNIKSKSDRVNGRMYLIVPVKDTVDELLGIFKMPEIKFVDDVLVIVPKIASHSKNCSSIFFGCTDDYNFDLITHKYVGTQNNNETIVIDTWFSQNRSFSKGVNLFPDKLKNQEGRILKLSTFTYLPYTIFDPATNATDGSEMQMIIEYAKRHNATLELVVDEEGQWGKIYPNWTGYGVGGNLAMDKSDLGASAMFRWEQEYQFLDFAKPFIRTGVTTLMPAPRFSDGWLTPVMSFNNLVWALLLSSFLITSAVFFGFNICRSRRKFKTTKTYEMEFYRSVLIVYRLLLQQSLHSEGFLFITRIAKVFLTCLIIYSMLVGIFYSCGLASSLAVPRFEGAIDTTEQFAQSPVLWAGTHAGAWIASIEEDNETIYKTIVNKFMETNISTIKTLIYSRKSGIPIERLPSGHYAIAKQYGQKEVEKLRPMLQDLYFELTVVMARKSSILLPSLNDLILKVYESGVPLYWESQVVRKYLNMNIQMAIKHSLDIEKQIQINKLTFKHISGALAVWMIGMLCSSICFAYELIYYRRGLRKFTL